MPKRTDIKSGNNIPPPLRGRSGGGTCEGRMYMPRAQELQIREYSRMLRKNTTDAEKCLWKLLRGRQLKGFRFRRQFPIDTYIADFICLEQRLIIELDGGQHAVTENYAAKRARYLEDQGFRVLRFWNNDVLQNTEGVVTTLLEQLYLPPPQPSPARVEGVFELDHAKTY